jgi:hypothetical protein
MCSTSVSPGRQRGEDLHTRGRCASISSGSCSLRKQVTANPLRIPREEDGKKTRSSFLLEIKQSGVKDMMPPSHNTHVPYSVNKIRSSLPTLQCKQVAEARLQIVQMKRDAFNTDAQCQLKQVPSCTIVKQYKATWHFASCTILAAAAQRSKRVLFSLSVTCFSLKFTRKTYKTASPTPEVTHQVPLAHQTESQRAETRCFFMLGQVVHINTAMFSKFNSDTTNWSSILKCKNTAWRYLSLLSAISSL